MSIKKSLTLGSDLLHGMIHRYAACFQLFHKRERRGLGRGNVRTEEKVDRGDRITSKNKIKGCVSVSAREGSVCIVCDEIDCSVPLVLEGSSENSYLFFERLDSAFGNAVRLGTIGKGHKVGKT
jgi:hypothetical protein